MSKVECECGDKIGFHDLERQLAEAQAALKCQVCGKLKAYTAICFDCLGEDVEEIARWHREVELSDDDGTSDICSQCHTGWPCDAIKALKLLAEAQKKLDAVREVNAKHLPSEGCPSAPCTLPQEIARILRHDARRGEGDRACLTR